MDIEALEKHIQNLSDHSGEFMTSNLIMTTTKFLRNPNMINWILIDELLRKNAFVHVAIELIRYQLPKARYGFDSAEQTEKGSKEPVRLTHAWVKFGGIDWTVKHRETSYALIIALLKVLRDQHRERNVPEPEAT